LATGSPKGNSSATRGTVEQAARAIDALQHLHPHQMLFPRQLHPNPTVNPRTDLRDHFQRLTSAAWTPPAAADADTELEAKYTELRQHCSGLETLLQTYATVINDSPERTKPCASNKLSPSSRPLTRHRHSAVTKGGSEREHDLHGLTPLGWSNVDERHISSST
jgi:hypothetical protein